jgi:hypothetical protein
MSKRTWVLADVERGVYVEQLALGPAELGGAEGCSVNKRTLRGGLSDGVDLVEVNNGRLWLAIIPTRGMSIWRARAGEVELGWKSPVAGPVHPSLVRLWEPSGLGWLDGFDELLVRCGLESNGAPEFLPNGILRYPLHGRIANIPARKVEITFDEASGEISVCGLVEESRLFGNKLWMHSRISTRVGQAVFTICDTISNPSSVSSDLELLYHVNFGAPLLTPGARVVLPAARVVPSNDVAVGNAPEWDRYGPETPGAPEAVFFIELRADSAGTTRATLVNAAETQAVSLKFNKGQLPWFTLWKNRNPLPDGYVTGLEPGINFPNTKSFERLKGRVASLAPSESRTFEIAVEVHSTPADVAAAVQAVKNLQGGLVPEVLDEPDPDWANVVS